jgi:type II secretory pathway pseudopilin PulG
MTLVEYLLALVVVASALGVLVMVSSSLRADTAQRQTRDTLQLLRAALLHYHDLHHDLPPGPADAALNSLLADPAVAPTLQPLPLLRSPGRGLLILDGFGRPIHYQRHQLPDPDLSTTDFVSTGPDGQLGDPRSNLPALRRAAMDNLLGADTERPRP